MSNNNNHILSGLFRSLSRRGQQRNTEPEPSDPQRVDVDMDNQQPTVTPMDTSTTTSSSFVPSSVDEQQSDELMPDLQDVSDSDESNGADWDFEDQNDPWYPSYDLEPSRTFPRTNDLRMNPQQNAPLSVPSRPTPSSTPSQGTRRARVEDDVDGDSERDRRHPSQRTSANTSEPSSIPIASIFPTQANEQSEPPFVHPLFQNLPPGFGITVTGGMHSNTDRRGHQHHFVPVPLMPPQMGFDARTNTQNGNHGHSHNGSPLGNNPESPVGEPGQDAGTEQPQGATHTNLNSFTAFIQSLLQAAGGQPGVAFSTTLNGVPVGNNMPNTGTPNGGNFLSNLFTAMSGMQGGPFTFNAGAGGIPFFGFRSVQEREDPERAKVLVDGLEEVPVGLIRRLERVSPESSGCAICWEKLLEEDAEYLKREEEEEKQKASDPSKVDNDHNDVAQNTSTELPSSSGSKANTPSNKVPKYPRIVALPCSHVFHADCLLPWFSRPRQTTCPTCRFNIDPDDLTRGIGARRRAAASAAAGGRGTERGTERVPREGPLPNVPQRIDENQFVDPVTGLALPQGDNAPGMPWANDSGNYVYIPIGTPIPGVPAGGFWAPRNAPVTSRTASTQPTNNTQGSTPSSTANTSTNPNVTERDTAHSTPSASNASNVNASANRSTPVAGNPYIDPATSATAGASRFSSRRLFGIPVEQTPTPDGRPPENTRAPGNLFYKSISTGIRY
ncbi:hypothetical protein EV361DRAFT_482962 [Lentinula raphanica]|nr:hypothetical protein EV361DRAFT_482962 [Lentinula raphanica]